tara:strand:+ start:1225 stop:1941 length:717 start_codon:yes stop_codon:yes gene_type:complete
MYGYVLFLLLVITIIVLTILIVNQNKNSPQNGGGNNTQLGSGNAKKGTYTVQSGDGCEAIASKLCGGDGKNYGQVLCDAKCTDLQPGQQIKYNCNGCPPPCQKVGTGIIPGPNSDLVSQYCTWPPSTTGEFPALSRRTCENMARETCGYVPDNKNTIAENVAWQGKFITDSGLKSVVTGSVSGNQAKDFCAEPNKQSDNGELYYVNFNCNWDTACGGDAGGTEHGACPTGPKDSWSTK